MIRGYIRIAENWDEVAKRQRVAVLSIRRALKLLAGKPDEAPDEPPTEQVEEEPEVHSPPEIFGVPVWFDGGEQEVSIIRRSRRDGRRDCTQGAPSHLSNAPQRCRNSTSDVAAKSTHPESVVICDFHSSATRSAALSWPFPVRGEASRQRLPTFNCQRWNSVGRWQASFALVVAVVSRHRRESLSGGESVRCKLLCPHQPVVIRARLRLPLNFLSLTGRFS
jgi:hypothetical protein